MVVENFIRSEHNLPFRTSYGTPISWEGFVYDDHSFETPISHMIASRTYIYMPGSSPESPPVIAAVQYMFIPRPKPLKR